MSADLIDTALNMTVYLYIGFLVWLATRPMP